MRKENEQHDFDPEPEDVEITEVEDAVKDKLSRLKQKLTVCEEEKRVSLEELQRTRADYLNSKKRLSEQAERDRMRQTESFIRSLLPLADSFTMAIDDPAWEHCDEKWRKGVEAIHAQLRTILAGYNVTPIDSIGVAFNPHEHEAISNVAVTDEEAIDTVQQILQNGYRTEETVIRPARVVVGIKE